MSKMLRGAVGVIVVLTLAIVVLNWWGDFRTAKRSAPGSEATSTASSSTKGTSKSSKTTKSAVKPSSVVVLIDGLNFRMKPASDATTIRGLNKGDKLTFVLKKDSWYQVRDAKGTVGWVTADSQYTRLATP